MRKPAKSIREAAERIGMGIEIKSHDPKKRGRQTFRSVIHDLLIDQEIRHRLGMAVRSMIERGRKK